MHVPQVAHFFFLERQHFPFCVVSHPWQAGLPGPAALGLCRAHTWARNKAQCVIPAAVTMPPARPCPPPPQPVCCSAQAFHSSFHSCWLWFHLGLQVPSSLVCPASPPPPPARPVLARELICSNAGEYWLLLNGVGSLKEDPGEHRAAECLWVGLKTFSLIHETSANVCVPVILRCSLDHDLIFAPCPGVWRWWWRLPPNVPCFFSAPHQDLLWSGPAGPRPSSSCVPPVPPTDLNPFGSSLFFALEALTAHTVHWAWV